MPGEILKDIIAEFVPDKFIRFFRDKNRSFRVIQEAIDYYNDDDFSGGIKLGEIAFTSEEKLIVCSFKVNKDLTQRSGKKAQYEKGRRILRQERADAGIFIFYDPQHNFRFSLIYTDYFGTKRKWNNFRRFTYFVSKELTNKTFLQRIGDGDFSNLEKIKDAFSVEKVTKEFFRKLSNWYAWAIDNVQFPKDAEEEKKGQTGRKIALIRFLARFIFIWFMKQKRLSLDSQESLIPDYLFDENKLKNILKDFNSQGEESSYYKAILQNLFFATLSTRKEERRLAKEGKWFGGGIGGTKDFTKQYVYRYKDLFIKQDEEFIKSLFEKIPFINGGLFECLDRGKDDVYIDGFTQRSKKYQPIFPNKLLFLPEDNNEQPNLNDYFGTKNKKYKVEGLINILKRYNFTVDENTPTDVDVALDPELLGRIFENLLASYNPETATTARKATGSYYTPREIVHYMVDESLKEYFKNKLNGVENIDEKLEELFSYDAEGHSFNKEEIRKIVEAIDGIRVIDPAVGSGAFPMGILQRLVHLLSKLDPDNKIWRELQRHKIIKKVGESFKKEDKEQREKELKELNDAFERNTSDYGRKLYLIKNCIYGIDIQTIATQIAKLRFFISLLVDMKPDDIKPLPNLDFKFVSANSLIPAPEANKENVLFKDEFFDELEHKIEKYFYLSDYKSKNALKEDIEKLIEERINKKKKEIENEIVEVQTIGGGIIKKVNKEVVGKKQRLIDLWDSYKNIFSHDKPVGFFDTRYFFPNVKDGFDIVIANPPYGIKLENVNTILPAYKYFDRQKNSASFFIEFATKIANNNGVITYIVPKSLSFSEGWRRTRDLIVNHYILQSVIDVSKAFENVLLEQVVICFAKKHVNSNYSFYIGSGWTDKIKILGKLKRTQVQALDILPNYIDSKKLSVLKKLQLGSILLSDISETFRGLPYQRRVSNNGMPVLRGKNIGRYIIYGKLDKIDLSPNDLDRKKVKEILRPKMVSQNIVAHVLHPFDRIIIMSALDKEGILTLDTVMNTYLTTGDYSLEYILAIVNSKLASWFYYWFVYNRAIRTMHFDKYYIGKMPIKVITKKEQSIFAELVNQILSLTESEDYLPAATSTAQAGLENPTKQVKACLSEDARRQVKQYEHQIDQLVYKLYGLTEEEIRIVENSK